jgi:hypothetical protein
LLFFLTILLPSSWAKWAKIVIYGYISSIKIDFCVYFTHLTIPIENQQMPTVTQNPSGHPESNLFFCIIPSTMLLQIGTASILLLLLAEKASAQAIIALGEASEELFRGDRLPLLEFPADPQEK